MTDNATLAVTTVNGHAVGVRFQLTYPRLARQPILRLLAMLCNLRIRRIAPAGVIFGHSVAIPPLRHVVTAAHDQKRRVPDLVAGHGPSRAVGPAHLPGTPGRFLSVAAAGQVSPRSQAGLRRSYSNCAAMDSSLRGTLQCSAYNASCSGAILVFRSDRGIATP
jgi:hypothetical protein